MTPASKPSVPITGTVPGTYVRLLFDYLAARQLDPAAVLGVPAPAPGREPSYPAAVWRRLLETAAVALGDTELGLHVGQTITPAHLGPLGYVLAASTSMTVALERYMRFQRLVHDVSPVSYRLDGDSVVLEWSSDSQALGALVNQCGLAALVQFARHMAGQAVAPAAVSFVEPAPAQTAVYTAFFGCPVHFAQPSTQVCFPAAFLATPPRRPDPALAAMLERQVETVLAALPPRDNVEHELRRRLSRQMLEGEPSLDRVAAELRLSGRTLRRQLQAMGWSFRRLLEDTRQRLAADYLRDPGLGLAEVALLLGYSEQSAFNRACRRWTGLSPRRWRMHLNGAVQSPDAYAKKEL